MPFSADLVEHAVHFRRDGIGLDPAARRAPASPACGAPARPTPDCTITTRSTARGGGTGRAPGERLEPEEDVAEEHAADVGQMGDAVVRREEVERARRARPAR